MRAHFLTQRGFTLIELSIVLVIIGLTVGGVLVGQDLIRVATVRAQISQIEKYNAATNTFRGKYSGLPGDILSTNASQFGMFAMTAGPVGAQGQGDGNGLVENGPGGGAWIIGTDANPAVGLDQYDNWGEQFVFWRHLTDARLINGSFGASLTLDGTPAAAGTDCGLYFPPAKMGAGNFVVAFSDSINNYFGIGIMNNYGSSGYNGWGSGAGSGLTTGGMTPLDAYNVDRKVDDGMPNTGRVHAMHIDWGDNDPNYGLGHSANWSAAPSVGVCITGGASSLAISAAYNTGTLGGKIPACSMSFRFQ